MLHVQSNSIRISRRYDSVYDKKTNSDVLVVLRSCPSSANFSIVAYFHGTLHLDIATSSTVIAYLVGAVLVFAALMNFISDAYIKRTTAIFVFGPFVVLVLTASSKRQAAVVDAIELQETGTAGSESTIIGTTQVEEETKAIIRMLPIFISCLLTYLPFTLLMTLTIQVGSTMDTGIGAIQISSASLIAIPTAFHMLMQPCYRRVLTPLLRRFTGHAQGVTPLQRIGAGSVCGTAAACVAMLVETKRLTVAERHGLISTGAGVPMSVFWLVMQFFLLSIMDAASFDGLTEFIKSDAPPKMKLVAPAVQSALAGLAAWSACAFVQLTNSATRRGDDGRGWLDGANFNRTRLDRFFLLLAAFELAALINYAFWARRYANKKQSSTVRSESDN